MGKQGDKVRERRLRDNMGVDLVLEECLEHITKFDCAVDGGAHTGYVTQWMAARFQETYAFEPGITFNEIPELRDVYDYQEALGDERKQIAFQDLRDAPRSSHIAYGDKIKRDLENGRLRMVYMVTIDSLDIRPDFIKLDLEGYEIFAIRGAERTIKEYHPVMLVEYKHWRRFGQEGATELLEKWGYKEVADIRPDKIMVYG